MLSPAPADFSATAFTKDEVAAVRLGASDPLSSLHGGRSRLMRWLLGRADRLPLANPQLEALRRLAVLLGHARMPSRRQIDAALRAGVSELQLQTLWSLFRGDRSTGCPA
jgi:hypothetical protein